MRSSYVRLLGCALGTTLFALGTVASAQGQAPPERPPPAEAGRLIRLETPTQEFAVQVTPTFVIGPDLWLARDGDDIYGSAFGRSVFVSLDAKEENAAGLIGTLPASFTFGPREDVPLRLEGVASGGPVKLTVTTREVTGTVGLCSYALKYQPEAKRYEGSRICAGTPWQTVSLVLPPELLEKVEPMTVMALEVLLEA